MSEQNVVEVTVAPPVPEVPPVPAAPAVASAVPAEARERLTDRLRKKMKPKEVLVDLGDGDMILVLGQTVASMDAIVGVEKPEDGEIPLPSRMTPPMFRSMCFDPETREPLFGQPVYDPETGEKIDGWTDEEMIAIPSHIAVAIQQAIGIVSGRSTEPGKDSPSTGDTDSSST